MTEYLLIKRDLYWRPGGMGYTGIKDNAGRYSREEAEKIVGHGVTMVPFDEAPDFTNACFDDLARDHLIKQRDEARAEVVRLLADLADAEAEIKRLTFWEPSPF